jgi:hypothetical protein
LPVLRITLAVALIAGTAAWAHEPLPDGGVGEPDEDDVTPPAVEPPVLLSHEDPV